MSEGTGKGASLEAQLYEHKRRAGFDAPADAEWDVTLTAKEWREIEAALTPPTEPPSAGREAYAYEVRDSNGNLLERKADFETYTEADEEGRGAGFAFAVKGHANNVSIFRQTSPEPQPSVRLDREEGDSSDSDAAPGRSGRPQVAPSPWRTIDSAPKDGTDILLFAPSYEWEGKPTGERVTVGHWTADEERRRQVGDCGGECRCPEYEYEDPSWISWDGGFRSELPPTHWMPLPDGPTAQDETGETYLIKPLTEEVLTLPLVYGEPDFREARG